MGFIVSQAVYVATKLEVPDLLADGPRTAAELADATGADADSIYRLLRLLAGDGVFVEHPDGRFANSELGDLLRDGPGSFREFALVFGEDFYPPFGELLRSTRTGEPAYDAAFGRSFYEYLEADLEASTRFNRFMGHGKAALAEALAAGEWRGDEIVVDVGGGNGALLQTLLDRRPGLQGIVFDLPSVAAEAESRIRAAGLAGRCEVVAGSFFDEVPHGGDVYLLSHILHGFEHDRACEILRTVRRAIPDGGRMLVADGVVAPPNEPGLKLMDLVMLAVGGRERTEEEWRALIADGGFELTAIRDGLIEAVPAAS
jgi:hypothetical protein